MNPEDYTEEQLKDMGEICELYDSRYTPIAVFAAFYLIFICVMVYVMNPNKYLDLSSNKTAKIVMGIVAALLLPSGIIITLSFIGNNVSKIKDKELQYKQKHGVEFDGKVCRYYIN